jgi:glucose-1-phosphate adenylyltransferase
MDLVSVHPVFNLYNYEWPIYTMQRPYPPAKFVFAGPDRTGRALDSLVSNGVIVSGGLVRRSVLSPNVFIHSWADVEDCVLMDNVRIGRHAVVRRAIIDKNVIVPDNARIGVDEDADRKRFTRSADGIVVIGKGERLDS